jgi:hypothetical protein
MLILLHREGIVVLVLHGEGIVVLVLVSMILTPFLCSKLVQMTYIIFSTSLEIMLFARYVGKFTYVLGFSVH